MRSAPVDVELSQRIYWLIQLRWLASSAVIYGTLVVTNMVGVRVDPMPLYLIGAAIAVYNSFFIIALKWTEVTAGPGQTRHARSMANLQIVVDLFFLTLLTHFCGGVENALGFYFIFHVIIASILLPRRDTFIQATVASLLFGSMVLAEYVGAIPHVHLLGLAQPDLARDGLFVGSTLLVFASTLYLAAYMATSIMGRLRERDRDILDLSGELERKALELQDAYDRLAELERIKSQHMFKVSQEIRAPLAAIQASLKAVQEGPAADQLGKQREAIVRAERRTQGLLNLVADLLVLSRAREARLFTERKWAEPREIIERIVATEGPRAAAREVCLLLEMRGEIASIYADPEALGQLLSNLVNNAIDYTPSGGRVVLRVDSLGSAVRFQISDTGIGIPSEAMPRIFNEFYRAENARRFKEEGTGLGLSIVRGIVETNGGEIDVRSEVGLGSTFTVVLPARAEPADQDEADNREPQAATEETGQQLPSANGDVEGLESRNGSAGRPG